MGRGAREGVITLYVLIGFPRCLLASLLGATPLSPQ